MKNAFYCALIVLLASCESETLSTTPSTMVHCAFGWGGTCDGYFASGVFQFYDSDGFNNYRVYLKTITYSNPNS